MLTPFPELDTVLLELTAAAREVLGDTWVGCSLQGSFALGAGDAQSDADLVLVTTVLPSGEAEAGLRRLHAALPDRPGAWSSDVEGSYADVASLRSASGLGVPWLFFDRGQRELRWVEQDRASPWRPVDPPRPGSMEQALADARHVEAVAAGRG